MANFEKHKMNPMQEWLEDDDAPVLAKAHGGGVKRTSKSVPRRFRLPQNEPAPKIEPALMREPSPPPKIEEKSSPAHREPPALRAPHSTKPGRAAGAGH